MAAPPGMSALFDDAELLQDVRDGGDRLLEGVDGRWRARTMYATVVTALTTR